MANKTITIPITDHDANCSLSYLVEWKLSTDANYVQDTQFTPPIVIANVLDSSTYNVRITRNCCNGGTSAVLAIDVDTTSNSPVLDKPLNLVLTPGSGQIAADCDDVVNATHYVFELAKDEEFTIDYQLAENTVSNWTFTGLDAATEYFCRVYATASGYADSPDSDTESATTS